MNEPLSRSPGAVRAMTLARVALPGGALVLAVSVGAGAFAAHAGPSMAHPDAPELLRAAVLYQFVHGLGLLAVGILARSASSRWLVAAGMLFAAGLALFCGSLWAMSLTGSEATLAAPAGGFAFIGGWIAFAVHGARG
jgi:uncharacterized membrane protein YgdD (TMEM256/DUF423 family)